VGDRFPDRFPTVFGICRDEGIDPRIQPVPVSPAAHYHMGGIVTDVDGRASLPGLYAVGETSRTGVHGANRLASNSLLEGLVFGHRAGRAILETPAVGPSPADLRGSAVDPGAAPEQAPDVVEMLREVMWERVGVVRHREGLRIALETLDRLEDKLEPGISEGRNMLVAARLVATAALVRPESRGGHFRADHPQSDPAWARSLVMNG
jgi:L-aspartate oxidase